MELVVYSRHIEQRGMLVGRGFLVLRPRRVFLVMKVCCLDDWEGNSNEQGRENMLV